jgi:predicted DNA-binding transcriptional regulator AlpA
MPVWPPGKPPTARDENLAQALHEEFAMPAQVEGRRLLRPAEVERRWDVSRSTLRRWAKAGIGPRPVRLTDGTVRYELAAVEAFERALAGDRP